MKALSHKCTRVPRVCNSAFARQKCATRHLIGIIARKTLFVLHMTGELISEV